MTTSINIAQRTWLSPSASERLTWDAVYTMVRSVTGLYSEAALPQYRLVEAVDREILRLAPYTFTEELWQATLTDFVDTIVLPWKPTKIVGCGWYVDDGTEQGTEIDGSCFQLWERQWRWIGPRSGWPTGSVSWYLHVTGRPRTSTDETTYCTVTPEMLLPMIQIELDRLAALDAGGIAQQVNQAAQAQRQSAVMMLPKRQSPPSRAKQSIPTVSTVVFYSWAQTDLTFADFIVPE